jgi:polypyrimidine tract-binding protein 2
MLQGPPGVVPPQFLSYGAPQFTQGSAQAPIMRPSGQGSQQMTSNVNYLLPPGSPQFMYLGNGNYLAPNAPGPQAMSFPDYRGQQISPGPQMIQAPGYVYPAFQQGPAQPMPQFLMHGSQQFLPGMEPQMMHFPENGGPQFPFALPRHPYNC